MYPYGDIVAILGVLSAMLLKGGNGVTRWYILWSESSMRHVALIIDTSWADQHHLGTVAGVRRYAQEHGNWDCILSPQLNESLRIPGGTSHYDGIIARITPKWAELAKEASMPLVNVRHNTPVRDVPTVAPDRRMAGCMAAEHLLARGIHHFGYLGYHRDENSRQQLDGFRQTLQAAGFDCSVHWTTSSYDVKSSNWEKFVDQTDRWINSWPRPMGVLACSDQLCRYLADFCLRKGLDIPIDVALIGTQNEPMMCLQPAPLLTSVDMGYDAVGYAAAKLLDSLMDGAKPTNEMITLPPKGLVARESTDVLAVEDPLIAKAMRYISERSHTGIDVDDVAEAVLTTRRTLERRFRSVLDRSIAEELLRLKIERAKRQLADTNTPVKKLALESGFINGKQMGKTFARVVGISPTEYRRQRRVK
jgi:LacI family transcriptional regulator